MAGRRRSAEDKNTKILRELASIPLNKQCFDCLQRGPTYINVTIGSFVCTTCSGILRGLTPPQRVKSISMTTFTSEEIEHLRSRGNEYCRYVWLGTYDTNANSLESEVSDDQRKRDFMVQKYEKKRWYVDPDIAVKKMQANQLLKPKIQPIPETQPLSRLLGRTPTPLVVQNHQPAETWPHPVSSASAPSISTKTVSHKYQSDHLPQPSVSHSIDLLSELAGNRFASPPSSQAAATVSTASENFADFANFDSAFSSRGDAVSSNSAPPPPPPSMSTSASLDAYPSRSKTLQQSAPPVYGLPPVRSVTSAAPVTTMQQASDRYAALADLDSLFNQTEVTKAPSWTVPTTSSSSVFDINTNVDKSNIFSSAPSNPFTAGINNPPFAPKSQSSFQSANPFQTIPESNMTYSQPPTSHPTYAPFPMVGNSPSDDTVSSQLGTGYSPYPLQQTVTSPSNGYQPFVQNGGYVSPPTGSGAWGLTGGAPPTTWPSSRMGPGGLFASDPKHSETAQHSDWMQNPVNPFMAASGNMGFQLTPSYNPSNPFL